MEMFLLFVLVPVYSLLLCYIWKEWNRFSTTSLFYQNQRTVPARTEVSPTLDHDQRPGSAPKRSEAPLSVAAPKWSGAPPSVAAPKRSQAPTSVAAAKRSKVPPAPGAVQDSLPDKMPWFGSEGGLANDKELLQALNRFHDEYAREPSNLPRARTIHTSIIAELQKELKRLGKCDRLEFTGSAYEGVQVGPEVEFDIMVVNRVNGLQITKPSYNCPGFFQLQASTPLFGNVPEAFTKWISQNNVISPNFVIQDFFGTLQKCIDTLGWGAAIKLRRHGPAVQMDVIKEGLFYSVDMVLTLEEGGLFASNRRFVPKEFKGEEIVGEMRNLWRESFSIEEKTMYHGLDRGNDCRKKCVRVIKVLLQNSDELKPINSYHLKNTIFHMNDAAYDWSNSNFLSCFLNVLKWLEDAIKQKHLFSYFARDVNILQNIADLTLMLLHHRLRRLQTNKNHLMAVLEPGRRRYEAESVDYI